MPTKRSGPRSPRPRIERYVEPAPVPVPEPPHPEPTLPAEKPAPAPVPTKGPERNPLFLVGASLYPLDSEAQSPEEWYERDLSTDLEALAKARCSLVRVFIGWRVLEPQVAQYSEAMLERLSAVIDAIRERKMAAIVCLFADDRHSELSDVTWGTRRDPRTDSYLVQRETALVAAIATHLKGESGVFGWQLGNEAFLSRFESAEALASWFDTLSEAIREVDPARPVGLGADAETLFQATGVDARDVIDRCELRLSHSTAAYRAYAAEGPLGSGPSTYLDAFLLRVAHRGRPVILDDIGALSPGFSVAEEAAHVRTVLWSGLVNRAGGSLVRRLRDMETEKREPYFIDPFETLVGVADAEGMAKPAFLEISEFVRTLARIDLRNHTLIAERTAVVLPEERYRPLPSLASLYDPRACLQSFISAKRAHVPVTVVRETDDFSGQLVLIVPSAFDLSDATWERLAAFVQGGGTLLLSYGGGDAHPAIREIFGVESLGDDGPREVLSCRIAQPDVLGALRSFDVHFDVPNFALLSSGGATVVATDAKGSPLLTVNQVGQGKAVYIAIPLERAIAQGDPWATPAAVSEFAVEVYGAVARGAGCGAPLSCDDADVEVALFQGDGEDILVLINHSTRKLTAALETDRPVASIASVRQGEPVPVGGRAFGVPLAPSGVAALKVVYA